MYTVQGYFDGNVCVPFDKSIFSSRQKVIITALDDYIPESNPEENSEIDFFGMWKDRKDMQDVESFVKELRKGRRF